MRIQATPFFLNQTDEVERPIALSLRRLSAQQDKFEYDEKWLQNIVHENPELIPASTVEPIFSNLIPVCRELPCPSGYLDNLYVTPDGYLVLVECKLWKNPESRRKVIAQIMDYAKDFASWDYDDLNQAIRSRTGSNSDNPLFEIADSDLATTDEITFVDRVSRNLKLGRHLLLIVGDGIQENMISLTEHVQQHMGLHFTLGLVEIGIYQFPAGEGVLIIPNVIAKTTNIERAVVSVENDQVVISQPVISKPKSKSSSRGTISEDEFFERLEENNPAGAQWLRNLLEKLSEIDVTYDVSQSLILRFNPDGETEFGLGFFDVRGQVHTGQACWKLMEFGGADLADQFQSEIASLMDGGSVKNLGGEKVSSVQVNGKRLTIDNLMGKEEGFYAALERHIENIREFLKGR